MPISKEFVQSVRGRLMDNPQISTASLALELGASEVQVITSLPVFMRKKARPQDFGAIWAELGTLTMLPSKHINENELGHIWFVASAEEPAKKHSVRFFDKKGDHLLSVYLDGDKAENAYNALCNRFGVTPVPKRHCNGCGGCSCGKSRKGHHPHAH